ncbi:MAG: peptide deformylase [Lachnospirales bacterium]
MAIRMIRTDGEEILRKKCKEVKEITPKIIELLDDMVDTLYDSNGVGLAAPQVGMLKRIVVIDIGEGLYELINPVILEKSGEQVGNEGCLSIPGKMGVVARPNYVKAEATNRDGERYIIEGKELMARAICHELDHLDGILYSDLVEGELEDVEAEEE